MRHHLPVTMAIIKKITNNRYWQGCGKKGTLSCTVDANVVGAATMENMEIPQIIKYRTTI